MSRFQKKHGSVLPSRMFDVFASYTGEHTTTYGGYIWEFAPDHPKANIWGFAPQHVLVAEGMIGRPLNPGECVHHKNEIRNDNREQNLQVMTTSEHRRLHARLSAERAKARLSRKEVEKTLRQCGSIFEAAKQLSCHHQTLRNRFPDLVKPYLRSSPTDLRVTLQKQQIIEVVRHFAPTAMTYQQLAKLTRTCAKTLAGIAKSEGIEWQVPTRGAPGKKRMVYRGKPTRHARAIDGSPTVSG